MPSSFRFPALAILLVILAGAFFTIGNDDSEDNTDFPPHSVQQ